MDKSKLVVALAVAIPLLTAQAVWIFLDARKRKEKYYWLWGFFGLINVPQSLIVYLVVTRIIFDRKNKNDNHNPL